MASESKHTPAYADESKPESFDFHSYVTPTEARFSL